MPTNCEHYPAGTGCQTPEQVETGISTALTEQRPKDSPAGLPVTGGDIAGLGLIGLGAALAGAVMVRRSRARARA